MKRMVLILALACVACAPTSAQIRSGLLLTARGVVEANHLCADAAMVLAKKSRTEAIELARTCTKASNVAIDALQAGEHALDAADSTRALCAVASGAQATQAILSAIGHVATLPGAIVDAVSVGASLASLVAGKCEAPR